MTVDFQKEAIQLRSELAMIRGLLHQMPSKLEPFPFTNLVQNGGFDVDANWTKGDGWTISGGVLARPSVATGRDTLQSVSVVPGARYIAGKTIISLSAGAAFGLYSVETDVTSAAYESTSGSYTVPMTAKEHDLVLRIRSNGAEAEGSIDNVSLWEADPSDDAPWLRLPFGYSVKECGGFVVRDGVILHPDEWEEINRCGQRFIKPLVAPGHDTDFLIFAGVGK